MKKPSAKKSVEHFVEGLQIGQPISHKNLTLVPLAGGNAARLDYQLASEAMKAGTLRVTELNQPGSVGELLVSSTADKHVLIVDGEELVGAKQNRVLNTTVLVPAGQKITIPVSCVEQGRWRYTSQQFSPGGYAHASLRAAKSAAVKHNLEASCVPRSDQAQIWDVVERSCRRLGCDSPTRAMSDVFDQEQRTLESYRDALRYPRGSRGVAAAVDGRFTVLDLFDNPKTLEAMWERLVSSYALDALMSEGYAGGKFDSRSVERLISTIAHLRCDVFPSSGLGEDWRFESDSVVGHALVADGVCVHLGAFPGRGRRASHHCGTTRVMPPSRRNHPGPWRPPVS